MTPGTDRIRAAAVADFAQLLSLWALLFDEEPSASDGNWREHADAWFTRAVADRQTACFPVVEVDGGVAATAIGTLEIGVPNPQAARGRTVRIANVITLPEHRGLGFGTLVVAHVIDWARSIDADRVDLSATPAGQRIYDKAGFVLTTAPRMKLVL